MRTGLLERLLFESELPLTSLVSVPGRQRSLSQEQFAELKANLDANPLTSPITVRPVADGKYEVIAGHNRVQAYSELGREKIRSSVIELSAEEAERAAFYSNLLTVELADFEKYLGLSSRAKKDVLTIDQLSAEAGISRALVGFLLSYDKLPQEALQLLHDAPDKSLLGANAAQKLVSLVAAGKSTSVLEAIRQLVAGKINQAGAIKLATSEAQAKPVRARPIVVNQGKRKFCSIVRSQKDIRLTFAAGEDLSDALVEQIHALIKRAADA